MARCIIKMMTTPPKQIEFAFVESDYAYISNLQDINNLISNMFVGKKNTLMKIELSGEKTSKRPINPCLLDHWVGAEIINKIMWECAPNLYSS